MAKIDADPNYAGQGIYREHILDHYKNPRNFGTLAGADIDYFSSNPVCGDEMRVRAKIKNNKIKGSIIESIKFEGHGCAISIASASMLSEKINGKSLAYVKKLKRDDIISMLGIPLTPIRVKCAVLALKVLEAGIKKYEDDNRDK